MRIGTCGHPERRGAIGKAAARRAMQQEVGNKRHIIMMDAALRGKAPNGFQSDEGSVGANL